MVKANGLPCEQRKRQEEENTLVTTAARVGQAPRTLAEKGVRVPVKLGTLYSIGFFGTM